MSNLFDSANFPSKEPTELQLGDFWAWKRIDLATDYPTAAYALIYEFNLIDGSTASNFTLTATEANDEVRETSQLGKFQVHCKITVKLVAEEKNTKMSFRIV